MDEKLLNLAFSSLPIALLEDILFQSLCSKIPLEFKLCGKIGIRDFAYHGLTLIEPKTDDYFRVIQEKNLLLTMNLIYPNYIINMNITEENNAYVISFKLSDAKNIEVIEFTKGLNESKVKIIHQKMSNGSIISYQENIYYYDEFYQKKSNPNILDEIAKDFSNLFYLPEELALFFYKNFDKYQSQLNRQRIINELEQEVLNRTETDRYTFMEPIEINALKEFVITYIPNFQESYILTSLKNKIEEEIIIFSKPLFEDIIKYLAGFTSGIICTKGIIISKQENMYACYQITINNEKIDITKDTITIEKAQELFNLSTTNQQNEKLKEFFGISKSR